LLSMPIEPNSRRLRGQGASLYRHAVRQGKAENDLGEARMPD